MVYEFLLQIFKIKERKGKHHIKKHLKNKQIC